MARAQVDVQVTLPRPLTSMIGRQQELDHLYELLRSEIALVTITGFGGIGKTRLSLQAALELEPIFDAGAIFVPLAAVTQPGSIPKAIALTAGLDESVDTVDALAEALGQSTRLLVLDNLEQIPDAAEMVWQLLQAMPRVTVLATSRNRLELSGEYVLPLEPLETQSDSPRSLPAVQLFIERAQAAAPDVPTDDAAVDVMVDICQKLDGIPLAIELAAARLAIFSLEALRDQLQNILPVLASKRVDMPDRQRTMRNAIAWTYELLEPGERRLFVWLSVYAQDFSLESVAHVAHQLELTDDPLDLVQFLVNRSLVRPVRQESVTPRYHMLQMLREFGHEQLRLLNEDYLARHSHAMEMVALAERAEPELRGSNTNLWIAILQAEIINIREAILWSLEHDKESVVLRIIGSTFRFLSPFGYDSEFLGYVQNQGDSDIDDVAMAKALVGIGNLQNRNLQQAAARESFSRARDLAIRANSPLQQIDALMGLGIVAGDSYELPVAIQHYREAGELGVAIGDLRSQYTSSGMMGAAILETGDLDKGISLMKHAIDLACEHGDSTSEGVMTANVAVALQYANRIAESNAYFQRAIDLATILRHVSTIAHAQTSMSLNYCLTGEYGKARELAQRGIEFSQGLGITQFEINGLNSLIAVDMAEKDYGAAASGILLTLRLMPDRTAVKHYTECASYLAEALLALRDRPLAARLFAATKHLQDQHGLGVSFWREATENRMQSELDADADPHIGEAMREGTQLSVSQLHDLVEQSCQKIIALHPPRTSLPVRKEEPQIHLTPRESEVLGMMAQGHANAEIADAMFVSTRTVTTHITNIFTKLDVNNRSKAVAVATQAGLI